MIWPGPNWNLDWVSKFLKNNHTQIDNLKICNLNNRCESQFIKKISIYKFGKFQIIFHHKSLLSSIIFYFRLNFTLFQMADSVHHVSENLNLGVEDEPIALSCVINWSGEINFNLYKDIRFRNQHFMANCLGLWVVLRHGILCSCSGGL